MSKIENGDAVIVLLQNPREKLFGILSEISTTGVFLRGLDLDYLDEWTKEIANDEMFLPLSETFLPMWRIEKITLDESSDLLPSLSEKFYGQTNLNFSDF